MNLILAQTRADVPSSYYVLLVFYLLLALGVSFLCSLVEAALLSLPRAHVAVSANEGRLGGKLAREMKANIDRPLAAILTLNTMAHTFGAAGVGAQSLLIFGETWIAWTNAGVTFLMLVFSEIIPKTIGARYCRALMPFTVFVVRAMIWITWPIVVGCNAISRLFGRTYVHPPSREEIAVVAGLARDAGILEQQELHIIHNLLRLREVKVEDVMTPRSVVLMLPIERTVREVLEQRRVLNFSRIPVYRESSDHVVGVVHRFAIYQALRDGHGDTRLEDLVKPLHAIPEIATVADALDQLVTRREHILLAVDEFGGTAGIITLEDAVETILGVEIVDETDSVADLRDLARNRAERRRSTTGPAARFPPKESPASAES